MTKPTPLSVILLVFIFPLLVSAQPWMNDFKGKKENFYDIQKAFNTYWEGRPILKGNGYKPFRRWEYMMEPRVYPTGNFQILSGDDEKIYDLIVRRFLSLFCDDAILDKKIVKIEVEGLKFSENGSATRKKAWLEIYPMKFGEKEIPDFNGEVEITKVIDILDLFFY